MYKRLAEDGYRSLAFTQKADAHIQFMKKIGYEDRGDKGYVLELKQ